MTNSMYELVMKRSSVSKSEGEEGERGCDFRILGKEERGRLGGKGLCRVMIVKLLEIIVLCVVCVKALKSCKFII